MTDENIKAESCDELKPVFHGDTQIGQCGLCGRLGIPFSKLGVDGHTMLTLGYCPVLKDYVSVRYGGCWKFKPKTAPKQKSKGKKIPLTKQWNGKTYVLKGNRWVEQEDM